MTKGPWFPLLFTMQWWMSVKIPSNSFQGNKVINFTKEIGSRVFCWFQNCFHERFLTFYSFFFSFPAAPKTCCSVHGTFLPKKKYVKLIKVRKYSLQGTKSNCTCKFEIKQATLLHCNIFLSFCNKIKHVSHVSKLYFIGQYWRTYQYCSTN